MANCRRIIAGATSTRNVRRQCRKGARMTSESCAGSIMRGTTSAVSERNASSVGMVRRQRKRKRHRKDLAGFSDSTVFPLDVGRKEESREILEKDLESGGKKAGRGFSLEEVLRGKLAFRAANKCDGGKQTGFSRATGRRGGFPFPPGLASHRAGP